MCGREIAKVTFVIQLRNKELILNKRLVPNTKHTLKRSINGH